MRRQVNYISELLRKRKKLDGGLGSSAGTAVTISTPAGAIRKDRSALALNEQEQRMKRTANENERDPEDRALRRAPNRLEHEHGAASGIKLGQNIGCSSSRRPEQQVYLRRQVVVESSGIHSHTPRDSPAAYSFNFAAQGHNASSLRHTEVHSSGENSIPHQNVDSS